VCILKIGDTVYFRLNGFWVEAKVIKFNGIQVLLEDGRGEWFLKKEIELNVSSSLTAEDWQKLRF
jgi:hypothetical protein